MTQEEPEKIESDIDNRARIILQAIGKTGWTDDPDIIAKRVKEIQSGISAEDEFAYMCAWSGKVRIMNKLEQFPFPRQARRDYQIPDFFAILKTEVGDIPVLIEVKTSKKHYIKWRKSYYEGLKRYADAMRLPLLVAYMGGPLDHWILFDSSLFNYQGTSYRVEWEKAAMENLSSLLIGDYFIQFEQGFCFKALAKKVRPAPTAEAPYAWEFTITETFFEDASGNRLENIEPVVFDAFFSMFPEQHQIVEGDNATIKLTLRQDSESSKAFSVIKMSTWLHAGTFDVNWRDIIRKGKFPLDYIAL